MHKTLYNIFRGRGHVPSLLSLRAPMSGSISVCSVHYSYLHQWRSAICFILHRRHRILRSKNIICVFLFFINLILFHFIERLLVLYFSLVAPAICLFFLHVVLYVFLANKWWWLLTRQKSTANSQSVCVFAGKRFCDLDLWTYDLENLVSYWSDCGKC